MTNGTEGDVRFYTDNIRTFVTVAELGGLSRAARAMGLSQPSVSQQIARLEALIGRKLFDRRPAGVCLTSDGEILLRHAQSMIEISDVIRRSFGIDGQRPRLSIGLNEMFSLASLHRMLWLVAKQNPDLQLRIVLARNDVLAKDFERGEFDVMVAGPLAAPARLLQSAPFVWIGRADAIGPVPDPVPLILPLGPSRLRTIMLTALEQHGRTWTASFEVSSVSAAEAAIEAGFGFCAAMRDMPLRGPIPMTAASGLPALPNLDYFVHRRAGGADELIEAFCKLVAEAVDRPDRG